MKLDKLGTDLVDEFLGVLNRQFYCYGPKKAFFWDHSLLIKAIQAPAVYLFDRGIKSEFPVEKYREVLWTVIRGIQHHGDTAKIEHFGRYFLTSVQSHMRHQGDIYYQEAIRTRNACSDARRLAERLTSGKAPPKTDPTVEILATAARLSAQRRIKRKVVPAPVHDLDLFAGSPSAAPLQNAGRRRADRP